MNENVVGLISVSERQKADEIVARFPTVESLYLGLGGYAEVAEQMGNGVKGNTLRMQAVVQRRVHEKHYRALADCALELDPPIFLTVAFFFLLNECERARKSVVEAAE
jgi:hypothetical protein